MANPPPTRPLCNPEKQMGKLLSNTETPSVEFDVLDEGTCVTMKCNAGFFIKVAKPTFYGLSQGFSLSKVSPPTLSSMCTTAPSP